MAERSTAGLVLAAGAGTRMGGPKALVRDEHGTPWVVRTTGVLRTAGCEPVVVVVGAAEHEVGGVLGGTEIVRAEDWASGMGASLRAGLSALADRDGVEAVLVAVVDTPGLTVAAVRRLLEYAGPTALARATYRGTPGHPVVLGCAHLPGVLDSAGGDTGARDYLRAHPPVEVECADLADGQDVDRRQDLPGGHRLG